MTSTVTALPPQTATGPRPAPQPAAAADTSSVRAFLTRYGLTLAGLLTGLALFLPAGTLAAATSWASAHPWPAAAAATAGWALGVAAWLRRQGWRAAAVHAVAWVAPAVL